MTFFKVLAQLLLILQYEACQSKAEKEP